MKIFLFWLNCLPQKLHSAPLSSLDQQMFEVLTELFKKTKNEMNEMKNQLWK